MRLCVHMAYVWGRDASRLQGSPGCSGTQLTLPHPEMMVLIPQL